MILQNRVALSSKNTYTILMIKYDIDPQVEEQYPQDEESRGIFAAEAAEELQPYDGGGWAGDGSGTDDFADYNQNEADDYRNEGCDDY